MRKYGYQGKLTATPGNGGKLAEILLRAAEAVSSVKGCHLYVVGTDATHPDTVCVTEVWDSKEDHDQSLNLPAVRALIGEAMPLLAGPPEKGQELEILGGAGLD